MLSEKAFDAGAALAPARLTYGLRVLAGWTVRGLLVGALGASIVTAGLRAAGIGASLVVALGCIGVLLAAGIGVGLYRWPDEMQTARAVDRRFQLQDRLTTALQLQGTHGAMARLVSADAARCIAGLPIHRIDVSQPDLREMAAACVACGVLAIALLAPTPTPPPGTSSSTTASDLSRIQRVTIIQLPKIARDATASGGGASTAPSPALKKIYIDLKALQGRLSSARNRHDALRAVSLTQSAIHDAAKGLHPINRASLASVSRQLRNFAANHQAAVGKASPNDAASIARALSKAANGLNRLTPSQRRRLAQSLEGGSNGVSDTRLRGALRRAAGALARNNPQGASAALRQASSLLSQSAADQIAKAKARQITQQLDNLKNSLAPVKKVAVNIQGKPSSTGSQNSNISKRPPQSGKPSNTSKTGGTGGGPLTPGGRTVSAVGTSRNNSSQGGSLQGAVGGSRPRAGSGVAGQHGGAGGFVVKDDTSHGGSPNAHGKYATVFVPGNSSKGVKSVAAGSGKPTGSGEFMPYHAVVIKYAASASRALERANLPTSLRQYVRRYFVVIAR